MTHYFIFGLYGTRLYENNNWSDFLKLARGNSQIVLHEHTDDDSLSSLLTAYDGWHEYAELTQAEYLQLTDVNITPTPYDLSNIDWSELRNQKRTLLTVIDKLEAGFDTGDVLGDKNEILDDLTGILHLIDSLQEVACDVLGMRDIDVFDFEAEEQRENETPEELFARENAELIFQMRIEGDGLYFDDEMSRGFIESIVDDVYHRTIIKNNMKLAILCNVTDFPNEFSRDDNGKLTYDYTMFDYGYLIEKYCRNIFNKML